MFDKRLIQFAVFTAIVVSAAVTVPTVSAQGQRPTVYLGLGQLRGFRERAVGGPSTFAAQVSLPIGLTGSMSPALGKTSLDLYISKTSKNNDGWTSFGILVTERVPLGVTGDDENTDKVPYFGFGLGFGFTQGRATISSGTTPLTLSKQTSSRFIRFCIGKNLSSKLSAEVAYTNVPSTLGLSPNHLTVNIGLKL